MEKRERRSEVLEEVDKMSMAMEEWGKNRVDAVVRSGILGAKSGAVNTKGYNRKMGKRMDKISLQAYNGYGQSYAHTSSDLHLIKDRLRAKLELLRARKN